MFLSHTGSVLENHYRILPQCDNREVLVNSDGYKLVSNICPHQNSLISLKNGKGSRVCPYHSWSFDINGLPITSGRTEHYCKNTISLTTRPVYEWNNLLFDSAVDLPIIYDFKNLVLIEERIDYVNADFKIITDIFLDVDHIQSVHSGIYDMVGITDTTVSWKYFENGSMQIVDQGALWISLYPYTMIEWQLGSLFVTVAKPIGKNKSKVHVFKFMDSDHSNSWKLNEKVWETAWQQDRSQAEMIVEFADKNLEPQKVHYREFLKEHAIY